MPLSLPCIPKTTGSNENIHFTIFLYFSTDLSLTVCTYSREQLFFDARLHVFSYLIDSSSEAKENKGTFPTKLFVHGNSFYRFRLNREKQNQDFRTLRNRFQPTFHHEYDNYTQYVPLVATWGMKLAGVESRSSWKELTVSNVFSAALMAGFVNTLKYTTKEMRPDNSSNNSFPSGHTATAFMCATILHKEYGMLSPWYSIGGYTLAGVTGITRQLNNRHWIGDVLVGAGIGMISTDLSYFFSDLIFVRIPPAAS